MENHFYKSDIADVLNLVHEVSIKKQLVLIGIDGCGASGKSTFSAELSASLKSAAVISMDDFYKPSQERIRCTDPKPIGWQFGWQRLEKEVLTPLKTQGEVKYQRYNWNTDCLEEWRTIRAFSFIIIEGIYALRSELAEYYDLRLWIECPREERLKRGLERDGEQARSQWEEDWMKEEDRYVASCNPHLHAHKIIQSTKAK
jgi:uridine kinase